MYIMDRWKNLKQIKMHIRDASLVAHLLADYAKKIMLCKKTEESLKCPTCKNLPICPITAPCGHTRCLKCIRVHKTCCRIRFKGKRTINIKIRDIIKSIIPPSLPGLLPAPEGLMRRCDFIPAPESSNSFVRNSAPVNNPSTSNRSRLEKNRLRLPVNNQERKKYVEVLLKKGEIYDAIGVMAHLAANTFDSDGPYRPMTQLILLVANSKPPKTLLPTLRRFVKSHYYLKLTPPAGLDCPICYELMERPTTTRCGHSFCRTCLSRVVASKPSCPLCNHDLSYYRTKLMADNKFLAVFTAPHIPDVRIPQPNEDSFVIPIIERFTTYPGVPYPMEINDPIYSTLLARLISEGSRRFGTMAIDRHNRGLVHGTVLEIKDCIRLKCGKLVISTVGSSRFIIQEKVEKEGCVWARVKEIHDEPVENEREVTAMARNLATVVEVWLRFIGVEEIRHINSYFGGPITFAEEPGCWRSPDGPQWVWQLMVIMPPCYMLSLRLLSSTSVMERMMYMRHSFMAWLYTVRDRIRSVNEV